MPYNGRTFYFGGIIMKKKFTKVLQAIGKVVFFIVKFGWFSTTLWIAVFAEFIIWHALPPVAWLRIVSAIAMAICFWTAWTGLKKKETEE